MAQVKKKKSKSEYRTNMRIFFGVAIVLTVIMAIYVAINFNYMVLGKTTNLNEKIYNGGAPENGEYVTLNVNLVLGNYAETKHKINGFIPVGTDQHYAIVLFDQNENLYIMSLTVKSSSDIEKLDSMVDSSWDILTGVEGATPSNIELTGKVTTMDSEIKGFYHQQLSSAGATTEYFKEIYDLTLDATESRFSKFLYTGLFLLFIAVMVAAGFGSRKQMKNSENLQAIARENASDPALNPFLNGGATTKPYTPDGTGANPYAATMKQPFIGGAAGASNVNAPENPYQTPGQTGGFYEVPTEPAAPAAPTYPTEPVAPAAPTYQAEQPTYQAEQPTYQAEQPTYQAEQPTYQTEQPAAPTYPTEPTYTADYSTPDSASSGSYDSDSYNPS